MSEKRKLTLSEIMARPLPEPDAETEAELAMLEELFSPETHRSTSEPDPETEARTNQPKKEWTTPN